jgi:hypothetical protein
MGDKLRAFLLGKADRINGRARHHSAPRGSAARKERETYDRGWDDGEVFLDKLAIHYGIDDWS